MGEKTSPQNRKMKSIRLSLATLELLQRLSVCLSEKDGVRQVTETEVIERAIHALARKAGVK